MFKEFRQFIMRGNVLDLAVAVIIGAAFNNIINSLVNDIIMPPLGLFTGRFDFSQLYINLSGTAYPSLGAAEEAGAAVIRYGLFINNVINFLIVAFVIFLIIRAVNRLYQQPAQEPPPSPPTREEVLLTEIRDLLKQGREA